MLSNKTIIRLSTLVSILAWVGLVFTDLFIVFSDVSKVESGINNQLPPVMLTAFILSVFLFYKYRIEKAESINFIDLLWKVFVTGLLATIVSLFFRFFLTILGNTKLAESVVFIDFIYLINLGLLCGFLISTFIVWKRLILYQKSKLLLRGWLVFEYTLLISLIFNIIEVPFFIEVKEYIGGFLVLLGIVLSANMKWVAYLNFKQKWKSILLIALAMFYLVYFSFTLFSLAEDIGTKSNMFLDFTSNVFIASLIAFTFIYALFSLLVILFNLPTSSVFEQKLEEVVNFQRLSQSIQTEQSEDRVYEILIESSMSTVFADAAWIEINENSDVKYFKQGIEEDEIVSIKKYVSDNNIKGILDQSSDKTKNSSLKGIRFRSIMAFPIYVKNKQIGSIVVLKEVSDGFNKEMKKIIDTFANQAGISIENFRLLSEALENERYKEELSIAKKVQSSLLPDKLEFNEDFDVVAFSESADEVGGDYYDSYRVDKDKIALIISDVSGKGTSAAFHMSQMKGVFHSLALMDVTPKQFLVNANKALSLCLDRTSFITTSFYLISSKTKSIEFARAGHCPTLYYCKKKSKGSYFKNKGLGLGILRADGFENYIQTNTLNYESGDIMVLYTDGITEAKNNKNEEYGYEKLLEVVEHNNMKSAAEIQKALIDSLYEFSGTSSIDDDYTTLIIKFK